MQRHAGQALFRHRSGGSSKPLISFTIEPEDDEADLLGKYVSDLQSGIEITNSGISGQYSVINGTLAYIDDYTGFSGDPALQKGNYLALRVDTEDENDVITVELTNGITGHPVTLDSDRNIVVRVTDSNTQYIKFTVTHTNEDTTTVTVKTTMSLKGLTLETEE